jgi:hypothetical protein
MGWTRGSCILICRINPHLCGRLDGTAGWSKDIISWLLPPFALLSSFIEKDHKEMCNPKIEPLSCDVDFMVELRVDPEANDDRPVVCILTFYGVMVNLSWIIGPHMHGCCLDLTYGYSYSD